MPGGAGHRGVRISGVEPGDDGELVAAESGDGRSIGAANQRGGHGDQELVADAVAERAVHLFELIEIEHGERDTGAVNGRIGEHLGELVVQGRAVRERREWIAIGERFEPPAGLHDLADVLGQNGDVVPRQRCDPDRYVQFDPVADNFRSSDSMNAGRWSCTASATTSTSPASSSPRRPWNAPGRASMRR